MAESVGQKLIAEKAGVSRTTVSVVLNNRPTPVISEKTRRRVLKVAKSMGYRPRPKITFPTGTHNLGVFVPGGIGNLLANPLHALIVEGIQEEAASQGFHLMFAMPDHRTGRAGPTLITQNKCDGVILVGPIRERLLEAIRTEQTPAVAVGDSPAGIESVVADASRSVRLAVEHLYVKGHRHIAYLETDRTNSMAAERFDAFRLAMLDHDLPIHRDLMIDVSGTLEGGAGAVQKLAAHFDRLTAVVACNDVTALGFLAGLQAIGKRVPADVSLIGLDDIPESRRAGLTCVSIPKEDMGRLAVKKLLGKISGDDTPANRSVVPVCLVERTSVADLRPPVAVQSEAPEQPVKA